MTNGTDKRLLRTMLILVICTASLVGCGKDETAPNANATDSWPSISPRPLKTSESSHALQKADGTPALFEGKSDVGNHDLYLKCLGTGSSTVILEAGWGDDGSTWSLVQSEVSPYTRTCAYDRFGLGRSDHGSEPETAYEAMSDLHALLKEAKIGSPYILVGHSLGGMYMLLFTHRFPAEVLGLILVDSSHPDFFELRLAAMPPQSPSDSESVQFYREWFSTTTKDPSLRSAYLEVGCLGDLPLVVFSAPNKARADDLPKELNDAFNQTWLDLHKQLTLLSSNSRYIIIQDSEHFIHQDRPEVVIDAILTLIEEIRQ